MCYIRNSTQKWGETTMNENDKHENGQIEGEDAQDRTKADPEPTAEPEEKFNSDTTTPDKPVTRGRWGAAVASFLLGVLLTFAVTYFWLGGQNEAVAVVNGEKITQDEFVEAAAAGGGAQVLDQMIVEKLIQQKAKEKNVTVSDKEYETELATLKKQFPSEEMFDQALAQQGLTEEEFREQFETNLLMEKLLGSKIEVSDKEVQKYFDENKEQFGQPEQVKAKQIVVESEEDAKKAHERLKNGEDFAKVAKDVSIDPQTKDKGGDLGTVPKGQLAQMDPNLEEKVFALDEGDMTEPIESMMGYVIVKVDEKTAAKAGKFNDEVAKQITEQLQQQKLQEEAPAWIEELRKDAEIDNKLTPEEAAPVMQG